MTPTHDHVEPTFTFREILCRVAFEGLARAVLVLLACMIMSVATGQNLKHSFQTAILAFSLLGAIALERGLKAERSRTYAQAANLYAVALMNYLICYASIVTENLAGTLGSH
jgi:Na+/melibiose symporter-like transporter